MRLVSELALYKPASDVRHSLAASLSVFPLSSSVFVRVNSLSNRQFSTNGKFGHICPRVPEDHNSNELRGLREFVTYTCNKCSVYSGTLG